MQKVIELRNRFQAGDEKRDEGLTTPENILRMDDVPYGDSNAQTMDVYWPKTATGLNPTIVSIHGGAWVAGSKNTYQYYCMNLAQRGFTVINCNYHMAPEKQFPTSIEDINLLFSWILKNGADYHIDANNLFIVSDSSGAQIASQYLALLTEPSYRDQFPFVPPEGLAIRACALNCGVYDAKAYLLEDSGAPIHYYVGELTEEKLKVMDTTKYLTATFPPTFIVSANRDFLLKNAQPMYDTLCALGVPSELRIFGTEEHPLGHVFHLDIRCAEAVECNDAECNFFRGYIHN